MAGLSEQHNELLGFQKIRSIYWPVEEIIVSQEILSFRELIATEQLRP